MSSFVFITLLFSFNLALADTCPQQTLLNAITVCPATTPMTILTQRKGNAFLNVHYENGTDGPVIATIVFDPALANDRIRGAPIRLLETIRVEMTYPQPTHWLVCNITQVY